MKQIWAHKWLLAIVTLVVFLSVGAVALATTGDDTAVCTEDCAEGAGDCALAGTGGEGAAGLGAAGAGETVGRAGEDRLRQLRRTQAALLEQLRDDMTAEDQALYDELVATVKEQREALQQARQDLRATLQQLRQLGEKYLDLDEAAGTAG